MSSSVVLGGSAVSATPRLVVSAPSSGHGKTAISVGLLAALAKRGMRCAGFKIGPDYVDAAYLGLAAGVPGRNLDPRMVGVNQLGPLFLHGCAETDIAVIEGTMGLYDGLAGRTDAESTAQVAGLLRAPVLLIVDVAAMGQSVAALVHGFRSYDEVTRLGGVILNQIDSDRHEQVLREALNDIGVPVLGAFRRRVLSSLGPSGTPLPPRHEGVGPVARHSLHAIRSVRRLGEIVSRCVDIEKIVAVARTAPRMTCESWSADSAIGVVDSTSSVAGGAVGAGAADSAETSNQRPRITIAVIGGSRLTYGYVETVELLRAAGADIAIVDPLRDVCLPPDASGLIVGGGFPESYVEELSVNTPLRHAVTAFARAGHPIVAEGAGLVWMCRSFAGRPMCGVLDATARMGNLVTLGYRQAEAVTNSVVLPAGSPVVGHKLHRTIVTPRSGPYPAWSWQASTPEGFVRRGVHASYLSLHWAGTPGIAARFVEAAKASMGGMNIPPLPAALPVSLTKTPDADSSAV